MKVDTTGSELCLWHNLILTPECYSVFLTIIRNKHKEAFKKLHFYLRPGMHVQM
jgi:hypothetical protein